MKNLYYAVHQNMVTFFKTPAAFILAILPVTILFVFGTLYPATMVLPNVITISIISVAFTFVGIQFIEYRQNKFFRTNKNLSMPNSTFLFGTFLVLIILLLITTFTLVVITWFFTNAVPILEQTIDNLNFESLNSIKHLIEGMPVFSNFDIANIDWALFFYGMVVSIIMTSLIAIVVGSVFKSVKSFTVLTLTYLVLFISLGGLAVPMNIIKSNNLLLMLSSLIPNTHTNNLMMSAMNYGHIKNADSYIAYADATTVWLSDIYKMYGEGVFHVEGVPGGIGAIVGNVGSPEYEDWMTDPLESGLVSTIWPWMEGWMQSLSDLFLNIDIPSRTQFFVYFSLIGDGFYGAVNGKFYDENFDQLIRNMYDFYHNLSLTLSSLQMENAFDLTTKYGLATNLIPLILILVCLPNFILTGGAE